MPHKTIEARRAYQRANRKKIRQRALAFYHKNREDQLAKIRARYAANPARFSASARKYVANHAAQVSQRKKRWRAANKDKIRAQRAERYRADPLIKEKQRAYRSANAEKIRSRHRAYYKSNPRTLVIQSARKNGLPKEYLYPEFSEAYLAVTRVRRLLNERGYTYAMQNHR